MQSLSRCAYCSGSLRSHWGREFVRCSDCGLVLRDPFPGEADLMRLYAQSWAEPDAFSDETGHMPEELAAQYVASIRVQLAGASLDGMRILDYGAGKGTLLQALRSASADAVGFEPYGWAELRQKGLRVATSAAELAAEAPFDGIVSLDVLEHLREPWTALAEMRRLIKPGGWVLLSTPNPSGLNARLSRGRWREAAKRGHILFMSPRTLARMMSEVGFVDVRSPAGRIRFGTNPVMDVLQPTLRPLGLEGATRLFARA